MASNVGCNKIQPDHSGDLAQLVEHLLCKQGVRGSTPLVSTKKPSFGRVFVFSCRLKLKLELLGNLLASILDRFGTGGIGFSDSRYEILQQG